MSHRPLNQHSNQPGGPHRERGQGFVEYVIIIALVGVAVIAIINVLEPAIANVFSQFVGNAPVAPPSLLSYTPPPTNTPTATPITGPPPATPTATNTPLVFPTPTNTNTPTNTPTNTATPTNTPTPTMTPTPIANILFVINTPENGGDRAVRMQLQALGHTVLVMDDGVAQTSDAAGRDLVLISSTVNSGAVGNKFRNVAVPVLLWENALFDEMGMTGSGSNEQGTNGGQTQINIANINHPLRGTVPTGNQTIYSPGQTLTWGVPSGNAVSIASLTSNSNRKVIFGYPPSVGMVGMNAPARRIGFFLENDGAANLNNNGWTLFNNAVNWAITGN